MKTNQNDWTAEWIWIDDEVNATDHEIVYFRKTFDLQDHPENYHLNLHVSADSRYRLFINGESVLFGPCKGDHQIHYYETIDISKHLQTGTNVIAAKALHFSDHPKAGPRPVSIASGKTGGFLVQGSVQTTTGNQIESLDTNATWKCYRDTSLTYEAESWMSSQWLGGVERVEGAHRPFGWTTTDFDDDHWIHANKVDLPIRPFGLLSRWQLTERPIPLLFERENSFVRVMQREGDIDLQIEDEESFYRGDSDQTLLLSPRSKYMVELDAGKLKTAYLSIAISQGKGSTIKLLSSECYEQEGEGYRRIKGIRDDVENGMLKGDSDIYGIGGHGSKNDPEVYEPFWFRTFRFVRLTIEVGDEPLALHTFHYRETGYPLEVKGHFESSESSYGPLWDISINTLQQCMHESYEDCPYYEQLQYSMDTRLQILFTYNISGDDRLARKAIHDFHSSLLPNGLIQSRYPSINPQIIPGFALHWIFMVEDHYRYYGDEKLIKEYLPTMERILHWFGEQVNEDGIVGNMPKKYWSFVDWVDRWQENFGSPTAGEHGPITVYSSMYVCGLESAARLNQAIGRSDIAREFQERAENLRSSIRKHCWSEDVKLFQDGPGFDEFSQHAQIWNVLADVTEGEDAQQLMERVLEDQTLAQVSFPMTYYLFRSLSKVGLYDRSFVLWDSWQEMVDLNLTTWIEDLVDQRSDCHAWGSLPLNEFPTEVLGIKPKSPGFNHILVEPKLGSLSFAKGMMPTKVGPIHVEWS